MKSENSYYNNARNIFSDSVNYFIIIFIVISASFLNFLFERIYDHFFNIGLGLLRNRNFRAGKYDLNKIVN